MNKELTSLEAFENTKNLILPVLEDDDWRITRCLFKDYLDIIETALKEQEEDKKLLNEQAKSNRYLMEQIKQSQKKLKALEIIKEKNVSIVWLKWCPDRAEYNDLASKEEQLTQDEYNLLKEVLL